MIGSPASMNSPSETTSTRSPSMSAIPAGRNGDAAVPRLPSQARSVSGADAKPSRAVSSVSRTSRRPNGRRGRKRNKARDTASGQQERRRDLPDGGDHHGPRRPGADEAQSQAADQGGEPEDPGDPEARRDEDLDRQEDEADADEQQLLPPGQPHQPVAPEEEGEADDAERAGHAEAGRPDLHDDPEDADRHQERADHRVGQEAHEALGPRRRRPAHLGAGEVEVRQDGVEAVRAGIRELVLQGLLGREGQELPLGDDAGNLHVGVHHRLGEQRRPLPALGGRAELLAHVGDGLLRHGLRRRAGRAELHGGGRPDRPAVGHDDPLGSEADQGPGRDGPLVHEGYRPDAALEQRVTDQDRRVHTSPERVDLQDHGGSTGRSGLV